MLLLMSVVTLPPAIFEVRAAICAKCPTPCAARSDVDFQTARCARCPLKAPRWSNYGSCRDEAPTAPPTAKHFGLGDLVAKVAQPIAKAIDAVAGTNVQGCGGCKKRQEALNRFLPKL